MKAFAALVLIVLLAAGFVLANTQRANPPQAAQTGALYSKIYTYAGKGERLKESGNSVKLVKSVETGLVGSTIVGMPSKGGSCQLVTTYKGGRINYEDGTSKECFRVSMEGLAGYPSQIVRCDER
ncbi:MAG TPA: hypothetical protein VK171_14920 [Fimbriimonas sp.]|nr:hypothetical protein [Fimbriimonas sp.]